MGRDRGAGLTGQTVAFDAAVRPGTRPRRGPIACGATAVRPVSIGRRLWPRYEFLGGRDEPLALGAPRRLIRLLVSVVSALAREAHLLEAQSGTAG